MKTNDAALALIHSFEGFSAAPYQCPAGVWTIGYGSTRCTDGTRVSSDTAAITEQEAASWTAQELLKTEKAVKLLVKVPLTENQFGALVSFIYNLGSGNFKASTLRAKLNRGDYGGASNEFKKWRMAAGRILPGLVRRRSAERALFNL